MKKKPNYRIQIFVEGMAGGFEYHVEKMDQVLAHVGAIVKDGYRRVDERGQLVWFPPARIIAVKASGPGLDTKYPDRAFRT